MCGKESDRVADFDQSETLITSLLTVRMGSGASRTAAHTLEDASDDAIAQTILQLPDVQRARVHRLTAPVSSEGSHGSDYFARHQSLLEEKLAVAVARLCAAEPDDPISWLGNYLQSSKPASGRYQIVDHEGKETFTPKETEKGGAVPIDPDTSEAELYWKCITAGRSPPSTGTRPVLVIMYGPPAVGKSHALKQLFAKAGLRQEEFVHVDPDACRTYSREYRLCVSGAHAAKLPSVQAEFGNALVPTVWTSEDGQFREDGYTVEGRFLALGLAALRSQDIVRSKVLWGRPGVPMNDCFVDRALVAGYNVVYDTMGNEPNKFLRELMRRARSQHDYRVVVCGVYAPWTIVHERSVHRATVEGRYIAEDFAKKEYRKMFPRWEQLSAGEVDKTHHDRFAEPDEEKTKPAPFAGGELRPGDERYLYDNSVSGGIPMLKLHEVTPGDEAT